MTKRKKGLMHRVIVRIWSTDFIKGSLVMLVGSSMASFGNYLYHLIMGRRLGPADYGALSSIISLVYFFTVPLTALNLFIVKEASQLRGAGMKAEIEKFYWYIRGRVTRWVVVMGILLSLGVNFIQDFLHLESYWPAIFIIGSSLMDFFLTVNIAFLTSRLRFVSVSTIRIIQTSVKVFSAYVLVDFGYRLAGAAGAFIFASSFSLLASSYLVGKIRPVGISHLAKSLLCQLWPYFILTLAYTSMYSVDVIIARHFLGPQDAGYYASLSTLGKIIPFAVAPISVALMPIIVQRKAARKKYHSVFWYGFLVVSCISMGVMSIYYFVPEFMVRALYGVAYLTTSSHLVWAGLFLGFYALAAYISQYFISIGKYSRVYIPVLANCIQVILLYLFHQSYFQILYVSASVSFFLVLMLLAMLIYDYRKEFA